MTAHNRIVSVTTPIAPRDCVIQALRKEIRMAVVGADAVWSVEALAEESGVSVRAIRTYMANDPAEVREPSLSAALSIACVLGARTVNAMLSCIGYGGAIPLDEPEPIVAIEVVPQATRNLAVIAEILKDGRIDHQEAPHAERASDGMVAIFLPMSSVGRAV